MDCTPWAKSAICDCLVLTAGIVLALPVCLARETNSGSRGAARVLSCVHDFVCVRALERLRLELSTPNLVVNGRPSACVDLEV